MSNIRRTHLYGDQTFFCPICGENVWVDIDNSDRELLPSGVPEYEVDCPYCGNTIKVSEDNDEYDY